MSRREFTTKIKVAAFKRAGGKCQLCGVILGHGFKTHYDHRIPDQLGGEPTLENCQAICEQCHNDKTRTVDIPAIAKAKRREAKYIGATRKKAEIKSRGFEKAEKPEAKPRASGLSEIARRYGVKG